MPDLPILVLNSGSSSIKFSIYRASADEKTALYDGAVDGIGTANGKFHIQDANGTSIVDNSPKLPDLEAAFRLIADALKMPPFPYPGAIGHRMVAGGPTLIRHQRITPEVFSEMERYIAFAPLHAPIALAIMRHAAELFPGVPEFVCFDSAFHATIPEVAARFAIPESYWRQGIRRYGAHGISYESILYQLGNEVPSRLIAAHLGNGCSVAAIRDGKSVDTSMGLTPTGGIISGSRTGDIDPGVLIYMLRDAGANLSSKDAAEKLEDIVDRKSGLLGLSNGLSDMRDLRAAIEKGSQSAQMAVNVFCYALRKCIGSYIAVLGGLDMLVFTGGIGEHDAATRAQVCSGLEAFGLVIDSGRNQSGAKNANSQLVIGTAESQVEVRVIAPEENLMIARHVYKLLHDD